MINKGLFTSNTPEWETPQDFFDELDKEFNFQFDVCATKENAKVGRFWNKDEDGLKQDWSKVSGWKWMNPPYGEPEQPCKKVCKKKKCVKRGHHNNEYIPGIIDFVKKANEEGNVVALLPSRTDPKWFHNYIYKKPNTEIRFIKGRLKFGGAKNSAPFPSMIVIFNKPITHPEGEGVGEGF